MCAGCRVLRFYTFLLRFRQRKARLLRSRPVLSVLVLLSLGIGVRRGCRPGLCRRIAGCSRGGAGFWQAILLPFVSSVLCSLGIFGLLVRCWGRGYIRQRPLLCLRLFPFGLALRFRGRRNVCCRLGGCGILRRFLLFCGVL